jgi:Ca2+-binding RTX toxin-like protein
VGSDNIVGTPGADVISDGLQPTTKPIILDQGNDTVSGGAGDDEITMSAGNDQASGGSGDDVIKGGFGNDTLKGLGGGDAISGGKGDDLITGDGLGPLGIMTTGFDVLYGQEGNDSLFGNGTDDDLYGGPGDDSLDGGGGPDKLFGEDGDDTLVGDASDIELDGGRGNDSLTGTGAYNLYGGPGQDTLTGAGSAASPTKFGFATHTGVNADGYGSGTNITRITNFRKGSDKVTFYLPRYADTTSVTNLDTNGDGKVGPGDKGWGYALSVDTLYFNGWNSKLELPGVKSLALSEVLLVGP